MKSTAPSHIRWLAFIGWLTLPILATWGVVEMTGLFVLWWGVVWTGFALVYMIGYFRWVRRKYPPETP